VKELLALKLSKYISEVVTALIENRFRQAADVCAAAEV
jgi:hypothetical protein